VRRQQRVERLELAARERGALLVSGVDLSTARGQRAALDHALSLVQLNEDDCNERAKAISLIVKTAIDVAHCDRDDEIEQLRAQVAEVVERRARRFAGALPEPELAQSVLDTEISVSPDGEP
jgi:hypothetical protein